MSLSNNFPAIRPSLLLDFANTEVLDPRITFSRPTTATYYDGKTVAKAEENFILYSQEFDNASLWAAGNISVTGNSTTAPDGTTTAETLTDDATSGAHLLSQFLVTQASTNYALSVFLKAGTVNFAQLMLRSSSVAQNYITAIFDLSAGTVSQTANGTSGTLVSSAITSVGNGWYRCQIVGSIVATLATRFTIGTAPAASGNTINTLGAILYSGSSQSIFAWGAQLEQRSAVTAYTVTTTQPITNYIPVLLTAQNNVARFEHNPVTGESLGLEIEEQRTNLALQSEDFSTTWADAQTTSTTKLTNQIVAPDGNLSADLLLNTTETNRHTITQTFTFADGTANYSASLYVKKYIGSGSDTFVAFYLADSFQGSHRAGIVVNTTDWTIGNSSLSTGTATLSSSSITHVGNNWYRLTISGNLGISGSTNARVCIGVSNLALSTPIANSYAGDGYSGFYIWGAQLEAGAFATSYIPTVASQVTRSADNASMTGTNFSSWFNNAEGTLYADYALGLDNSTSGVVGLDGGASTNIIRMRYSASAQAQFQVDVDGVNQVSLSSGAFSTVGNYKRAIAFAVNSFQQAINGILPSSEDTVGNLPIVNTMRIGSEINVAYLNGTIKKLAYYPLRITNEQLQALTGL